MNIDRPKITEVFTPRSATVNHSMYIERPSHERDLKRAIEGSLHAILCGESGSGKTWLYRHVAHVQNWKTFYANAGNASRYKTLTGTIALAIQDEDEKELLEYTQTLAGEVGAFGIGGSAEAERRYEIKSKETLLKAFKSARTKGKEQKVVLVIDNLEAIFEKPELMEELGNVILLLDDPDYAQYGVKILLVGVPSDVVEYYQRIANLETVSNRLKEVPAVASLNWGQIEEFVRRGFIEHLKIDLTREQVTEIAKHVENVTLGIAQRLHEYCEILGHNIEDSEWRYDSSLLEIADRNFLMSSLRRAYAVVEGCMNERKTKTGRRNQVLFALGKINNTEFDATKVEHWVRKEFPQSTKNTGLAVGQMLTDLTTGDAPLLRRTSKGLNYRFADPRYLMCIRVIIRKVPETEKVIKATLRR